MLDDMELIYLTLIKIEDVRDLYADIYQALEKYCIKKKYKIIDYEILFKLTFVKNYVMVIVHKKEKCWGM
jgi:hypothetical protein